MNQLGIFIDDLERLSSSEFPMGNALAWTSIVGHRDREHLRTGNASAGSLPEPGALFSDPLSGGRTSRVSFPAGTNTAGSGPEIGGPR